MVYTAMLRELTRVSRRSVSGYVSRRRAGRKVEKPNTPCHETRVVDFSNPEGAIDPFRDQVEMPLVASECQLNVRIFGEEVRQRRHDHRAGDESGRIYAQASPRGLGML